MAVNASKTAWNGPDLTTGLLLGTAGGVAIAAGVWFFAPQAIASATMRGKTSRAGERDIRKIVTRRLSGVAILFRMSGTRRIPPTLRVSMAAIKVRRKAMRF